MSSLIIYLTLLLLIILIFLAYFYTWTGLRYMRMFNKIPGYTELECWKLSIRAANLSIEGIKDLLGEIFGNNCTSVYSAKLMGRPNVYFGSPENIEVILKRTQYITKGDEYTFILPWLGRGLLTSTGSKWHANRKMLTPAFHFKVLESSILVFNENAQLLTKQLKEICKKQEQISIDNFISACSLDIISEAAMGVKLGAQFDNQSTKEYVNAVRRMSEIIATRVKTFYLQKDWIFNLTSLGKEQKRILHILHEFTETVIKGSKNKRIQKMSEEKEQQTVTFVDFLLEMSENQPGFFTDADIRQEVDTFMFEGHETTSASITWSLLLLGHNPDVQEQVYHELMDIFDGTERSVTFTDLNKMVYLEAVIKESLRLYPPVPFMSRKLETDLELEKYTIPSGTNVIFMPYFLHRQSNLYPDPEKFNPERFLNQINKHPFQYIPFSGGPRNCIGQRFAMVEMKVVLSNLLMNFKIESITQTENLKLLFAPILRPFNGTCIKLYARDDE